MSFPVDDFGMNIRAEVKAYNFGFSTAKNLASVIRANDKVTVVTFALPTHACFRPNGLGICPQNVTIIANSRYADQALELKQAYPELRIFLDPRVHAKMTLASSGKVWMGSANMAMSNSLDSTIGIESPAVYAYFMDQIRRSGLLCPENEGLARMYAGQGYLPVCKIAEVTRVAGERPVSLRRVSPEEYASSRRRFLPAGGAQPEECFWRLLAREVELFVGEDFLLAARRQDDTLLAVELLGNSEAASGILAALSCRDGTFRMPGNTRDFAMFLPLIPGTQAPAYFGLALD